MLDSSSDCIFVQNGFGILYEKKKKSLFGRDLMLLFPYLLARALANVYQTKTVLSASFHMFSHSPSRFYYYYYYYYVL